MAEKKAKKADATPKKPFHEIVAENLIAQLKAGTAPWQRPWKAGDPAASLPMNPTTGNRYKGINAIQLMSQFQSDPRWMTYKQAEAIGAQVRKGERSTMIQYWKFSDERVKRDSNGNPYTDAKGETVKESFALERPRVFFGFVFNANQIDGLPPLERKPQVENNWEAIERAENILTASGAKITHVNGDRAFYRPSTDSITLPEKTQFPAADAYYATALHELGHWTGHESRLNRDLAHPFGSEGYAKEELRAEISSMILGVEMGLGHDPGQHAAYVGSWVKALQEDSMEIFRAAADAEKIQAFVLAFEQQQTQQQAEGQAATIADESVQAVPVQTDEPVQASTGWIVRGGHDNAIIAQTASASEADDLFRAELDREVVSAATQSVEGRVDWINNGMRPVRWSSDAFSAAVEQEREALADRYVATAFFDGDNQLRDWQSANVLPDDWQGVAVRDKQFWYIGQEAGERTFTVLKATTAKHAEAEAAVAKTLAVDISSVLGDTDRYSFDHYQDFQGDSLEAALRSRGLTTIGSVTGNDPSDFIFTATDRLSAAWGIEPSMMETTNAYLERKGLATSFHNKADELLSLANEQKVSMGVPEAQQFEKPAFEETTGRLMDRLQESGLMSYGDATVTSVRRDLLVATPNSLAVDRQIFAEETERHLMFTLPANWTGEVQTKGVIDRDGMILHAEQEGVEPSFYGVYAREVADSGELTYQWLIDYKDAEQAQGMADRLALIDAYSQPDELERDKRLAQIEAMRANRVASTEKDASIAADPEPDLVLPATWTGETTTLALIEVDGQVESAEAKGVEPEFYGVYAATVDDGSLGWTWLKDFDQADHAKAFTDELANVAASRAAEGTLTPAPAITAAAENTYINVPFKEKNQAKELGAKWDKPAASWYVPAGLDLAKFEKWTVKPETEAVAPLEGVAVTQPPSETVESPQKPDGEAVETTAAENAPEESQTTVAQSAKQGDRQYLAVPYGERELARAAGAKWDKPAGSWYVGPNGDMSQLDRWLPKNVVSEQGPSMTPQEEFAEALRAMGCIVSGEHPIMDGVKHRILAEGDKGSNHKIGSGFYVGHLPKNDNEVPAGYIRNNRSGLEIKWKAKGYDLDPEAKAKLNAEAAEKMQKREQEEAQRYASTAARVKNQAAKLTPVTEPTPYMVKKGIEPQKGAFTDKDGLTTYLPATDAAGKHWTTQYINSDGSSKRFAKDSRKEGCFHVVGGEGPSSLSTAPAIVIGEGYATMCSATKALGFPTVTAFDSGNLKAVAVALKTAYPEKPIVFLGDNDVHLEQSALKRNPGKVKAQEAAREVGGTAIFPIFAPNEQELDPAGFTDFNDLANKSVLGSEGLERQVKGYVNDVIEKHQATLTKQQTETQQQELVQTQQVKRARSMGM